MANALNEDLEGRYVVLLEESMGDEWKDITYRVFLCEGGFGCRSFTSGRAIIGTTPFDGEKFRIDSYEIERFATDEEIALVTPKEGS